MELFFAGATPDLHVGRCLNRRHSGAGCTVQAIALSGVTPHVSEGLLQVGGAPTFLEGVRRPLRIR